MYVDAIQKSDAIFLPGNERKAICECAEQRFQERVGYQIQLP